MNALSRTTLTFLCLALAACSGNSVRNTLGLQRQGPDEFRVVARPPLSVPPQFNLRPPGESDGTAALPAADKQAQALITGTAVDTGGNPVASADTAVQPVSVSNASAASSNAEAQFLKNAGAEHADPGVRTSLVAQKHEEQDEVENSSWWDIFSSESKKKEPLVNAKKESERIKKNEEEGKPVTEGETPEVKGRDTGVLGRLFNY